MIRVTIELIGEEENHRLYPLLEHKRISETVDLKDYFKRYQLRWTSIGSANGGHCTVEFEGEEGSP